MTRETSPAAPTRPFLVISLDFELLWGVFDIVSPRAYRQNILGVREAIPALLNLFRDFGVRATWATVGCVTFPSKRELLDHLPDVRPVYDDRRRDPYVHLEQVGADEASDPYHFGYSLVSRILESPGMELGSHTFAHFCCLEPRENPDAFRADLRSSAHALSRFGVTPASLVFPRNQYDAFHLAEAAASGFAVFRGNETHDIYEPRNTSGQTPRRRAIRLIDAYMNLSGDHPCEVTRDASGLANVPSSRFLRPVSAWSLPEGARRARILNALRHAAHTGQGFHLWWHPHNFGVRLRENLQFLRLLLEEFRRLEQSCGMQSLTMREAAETHARLPGS